ncbi:hypothetical protein ABTA56_19215, partial [Acinetobacter baumannii]
MYTNKQFFIFIKQAKNMIRITKILLLLLMIATTQLNAQDAISYQTPPKAVSDLLLAKPTPGVSVDGKATWMLLSERNSY